MLAALADTRKYRAATSSGLSLKRSRRELLKNRVLLFIDMVIGY